MNTPPMTITYDGIDIQIFIGDFFNAVLDEARRNREYDALAGLNKVAYMWQNADEARDWISGSITRSGIDIVVGFFDFIEVKLRTVVYGSKVVAVRDGLDSSIDYLKDGKYKFGRSTVGIFEYNANTFEVSVVSEAALNIFDEFLGLVEAARLTDDSPLFNAALEFDYNTGSIDIGQWKSVSICRTASPSKPLIDVHFGNDDFEGTETGQLEIMCQATVILEIWNELVEKRRPAVELLKN